METPKEKKIKQPRERVGTRPFRKSPHKMKEEEKQKYISDLIEIYNKPAPEPEPTPEPELPPKPPLFERMFGDVRPKLRSIGAKVRGLKQHATTILGGITLLFALIGLVASVIVCVNGVITAIDNTNGKAEYEDFIAPLVMLDPPFFNDVANLDSKVVLSAGIWNLIMLEDTSKYVQDEFGFITVSEVDVDAYITRLFGEGLVYTHQSISDSDYSFEYNAEAKTYTVPSGLSYLPYMPRVSKISKVKADTYRLTVDYIPTGTLLLGKNDFELIQASKVLYYDVVHTADMKKVISVSEKPGQTAVSSQSADKAEQKIQTSTPSDLENTSEAA